MAKRQKHVFRTDEIPHLWIHQTQDSARNPGGNLFFEKETIFSYGHHFAIARLVESKKTAITRAVLFNSDKYSVTTAKQQSQVRRAIPNTLEVFEVPDVFEGHKGNLAYYKKQAENYFAEALRAVHSRNIEWKTERAQECVTESIKYAQFFGLSPVKINQPLAEIETRKAYISEREQLRQTPEWAEKREKALQKKHAAILAKHKETIAENVERFRNGESYSFYFYGNSRSERRFLNSTVEIPTLLRISKDGKDVETSKGARVPVEHARRGLRFVRSVVQSGKEYVRNGHTLHLGHYAIDKISVDGTLYAGCHVIPYSEIERLAPSLESVAVSESDDNSPIAYA